MASKADVDNQVGVNGDMEVFCFVFCVLARANGLLSNHGGAAVGLAWDWWRCLQV